LLRTPTIDAVPGWPLHRRSADMLEEGIAGRGYEPAESVVRDQDDQGLFGDIFLPHLPEAYRLARWLTGNAADAEDVVQDAAVRAFRNIRAFGDGSARAWSLKIVRNTAYSWMLKNRPKSVVASEDLTFAERQTLEHDTAATSECAQTPEDIVLAQATAQAVRDALAMLPAPFREIIVLREMHDLNYRDIADIANLPIGTVMSRLARARQMLIAILGTKP
jgi:RNA polymerase sigma factor (sigma-70 family)